MSSARHGLFAALGLLCLCGCTTEPRSTWTRVPAETPPSPPPAHRPPETTPTSNVTSNTPTPPRVEVAGTNRVDSGVVTNAMYTPPPPPAPYDTWVALDTWAAEHHWTHPERVPGHTNRVCQLASSNGVLSLTVGSRQAVFDGVSCWLGFGPTAANGKVLVQALDASKNLRPLGESLKLPPASHRVIVIDPGHGGENPGTHSVDNYASEKNYTLDWALRLRSLLTNQGWHVVLTRTNDVDVALTNRVAIADRVNADLFISLHFNSGAARPDLAGLETFCLTPLGLPSTLTRDFEDDVAHAYPNNAFDDQNLRLAFGLHRALLEATGMPDRGVRRARFMTVLRGQKRPAVLLEAGYLSNPDEARRIGTESFRQKLAEAVAGALIASESRPVETERAASGEGPPSP